MAFDFTETVKLQFQAEGFNVLKQAQFNSTSGNVNNPDQGGFDTSRRTTIRASCRSFKAAFLTRNFYGA
jgi:hypothetical protein